MHGSPRGSATAGSVGGPRSAGRGRPRTPRHGGPWGPPRSSRFPRRTRAQGSGRPSLLPRGSSSSRGRSPLSWARSLRTAPVHEVHLSESIVEHLLVRSRGELREGRGRKGPRRLQGRQLHPGGEVGVDEHVVHPGDTAWGSDEEHVVFRSSEVIRDESEGGGVPRRVHPTEPVGQARCPVIRGKEPIYVVPHPVGDIDGGGTSPLFVVREEARRWKRTEGASRHEECHNPRGEDPPPAYVPELKKTSEPRADEHREDDNGVLDVTIWDEHSRREEGTEDHGEHKGEEPSRRLDTGSREVGVLPPRPGQGEEGEEREEVPEDLRREADRCAGERERDRKRDDSERRAEGDSIANGDVAQRRIPWAVSPREALSEKDEDPKQGHQRGEAGQREPPRFEPHVRENL